jgi:hypothetical protein
MEAITSPPHRRPVTLVHVMKKKLRSVRRPSRSSETELTSPTNSTNSSRSSHVSPSFSSPQRRGGSPADLHAFHGSRRVVPNAHLPTTSLSLRHHRPTRPQALPTPDFYDRFPHAVGPLANVVVTTLSEYHALLLTAKRIRLVSSKTERNVDEGRLVEDDVRKGGFLVYQPEGAHPQYFQLFGSASDVYGSASYVVSA